MLIFLLLSTQFHFSAFLFLFSITFVIYGLPLWPTVPKYKLYSLNLKQWFANSFFKSAIAPILAIKAYGGVKVYVHPIVTLSFDGGTWLWSRPCCFTPQQTTCGTHWTGGCMDSRAGNKWMETEMVLDSPGNSCTLLGIELSSPYPCYRTNNTTSATHLSLTSRHCRWSLHITWWFFCVFNNWNPMLEISLSAEVFPTMCVEFILQCNKIQHDARNMKSHLVIARTLRHTEIPALPESWLKHICPNAVSTKKKWFPLCFHTNVTC
jgi:hypothetical protein